MKSTKTKYLKLADKIVEKVQKRIDKEGAYENAGQDEIRKFMDKVRGSDLFYIEQCQLSDYINSKIDNLNY